MRDLLHFAIPNAADDESAATAPQPLSAKADALVCMRLFLAASPSPSLSIRIERRYFAKHGIFCFFHRLFCFFSHRMLIVLILVFARSFSSKICYRTAVCRITVVCSPLPRHPHLWTLIITTIIIITIWWMALIPIRMHWQRRRQRLHSP
jgi:hypothetical protein